MIIYVNDRMEIHDVDSTTDETLVGYELVEDNPFVDWSIAKICCYKVTLDAETITNVIGTKEEKYKDLDGIEQTSTVDVTETVETGKYIVSMMTPYVDSRLLEHFDGLGKVGEQNTDDISTLEENLAQADDTAIELYESQQEQEAINNAQDDALIEIYEMIGGM